MEELIEWSRNLFQALATEKISRNKQFAYFSSGRPKAILARFRTVRALRQEAQRLGAIPGTYCWVGNNGNGLDFHLECPKMRYKRVVALNGFEWEWLGGQEGIQRLLVNKSLEE